MSHQLTITVHPDRYAICRLEPGATLPAWAGGAEFLCVTRTSHELSIVCSQTMVPESVHAERDRRLLQIEGTLAFTLIGVLASVATPLADAEISIFAVSTYDTDSAYFRKGPTSRCRSAGSGGAHHSTYALNSSQNQTHEKGNTIENWSVEVCSLPHTQSVGSFALCSPRRQGAPRR